MYSYGLNSYVLYRDGLCTVIKTPQLSGNVFAQYDTEVPHSRVTALATNRSPSPHNGNRHGSDKTQTTLTPVSRHRRQRTGHRA